MIELLLNMVSFSAVFIIVSILFGKRADVFICLFWSFLFFLTAFYGDSFARSFYLDYLCFQDEKTDSYAVENLSIPEKVVMQGEYEGCNKDCTAFLMSGVKEVVLFNGESNKWIRYVFDGNIVGHVDLDDYIGYDSYFEKNLEKWRNIDIVRNKGDGVFEYRFHYWFYNEIKTGTLLRLSTTYHMKTSGWFLDLLANFSSGNAGVGSCIGKKPKKYFY